MAQMHGSNISAGGQPGLSSASQSIAAPVAPVQHNGQQSSAISVNVLVGTFLS